MQGSPSPPPKSQRYWFQFRLRSLLIAVALLMGIMCGSCAYVGERDRKSSTVSGDDSVSGQSLTLRYSERLRRVVGVTKDGTLEYSYPTEGAEGEIVKVRATVQDVRKPVVNSPSISHEKSEVEFDVAAATNIPSHASVRRIKMIYGPLPPEREFERGQVREFWFDRDGKFIDLQLVK